MNYCIILVLIDAKDKRKKNTREIGRSAFSSVTIWAAD